MNAEVHKRLSTENRDFVRGKANNEQRQASVKETDGPPPAPLKTTYLHL